jgi:diadenosine tetraphosphate (Ap4A) HIT family hydrolase
VTIRDRVRLCREGRHPAAVAHLKSGWAVLFDRQPLEGYCLLLSDPVVPGLNDLDDERRKQYLLDMTRIGDALLHATGAYRINYETWCNLDPELHTHVVPRFKTEPDEKRVLPACKAYDYAAARAFDPEMDRELVEKLRAQLAPYAAPLA